MVVFGREKWQTGISYCRSSFKRYVEEFKLRSTSTASVDNIHIQKNQLRHIVGIDEPEVHLHPKAINTLFKLLLFLVDMFQSYCIVSTHSPLIVRELVGRNVYLMRRTGYDLELGKIGIETLGEDISVLYNEIFGYEENATSLAKTVRELKRNGKSYKDIVCLLRGGSHKLSFSTKMLIKQIVDYEKP